MLKAALVQGRPMMVIAITTAAIIQPAAIHRPPKMIHSRFRSTEMADIPGRLLASFSAIMALPLRYLASTNGVASVRLQGEAYRLIEGATEACSLRQGEEV